MTPARTEIEGYPIPGVLARPYLAGVALRGVFRLDRWVRVHAPSGATTYALVTSGPVHWALPLEDFGGAPPDNWPPPPAWVGGNQPASGLVEPEADPSAAGNAWQSIREAASEAPGLIGSVLGGAARGAGTVVGSVAAGVVGGAAEGAGVGGAGKVLSFIAASPVLSLVAGVGVIYAVYRIAR